MQTAVKSLPDGYHAVTPYLVVKGAAKAIDFYKKVFCAQELVRMPGPGGKIGHAELRIGDSVVMLCDEHPEIDALSPEAYGGSAISLMVYVPEVDASFKEAISSGAKELRPVKDQFYGDRSGIISDPFGHTWTIATHIEDVTPEEMKKRMAAQ